MATEPVIVLPQGALLPDKQFFRIGEVATLLGVEPHVVRFWQQQFAQVRPERSSTGRLLFGRGAVGRLARIRTLLYDQGYTIAGAKKALSQDAAAAKSEPAVKAVAPEPAPIVVTQPDPQDARKLAELGGQVERLERELRAMQARLDAAETTESALRQQVANAQGEAVRWQRELAGAEALRSEAEAKHQAQLQAALGELDAMLTVWPT